MEQILGLQTQKPMCLPVMNICVNTVMVNQMTVGFTLITSSSAGMAVVTMKAI
jgi:hypothetical protein